MASAAFLGRAQKKKMQIQDVSVQDSDASANPDLTVLWQQAEKNFEDGEHEIAEHLCSRLIAMAPDQPMAYLLMARLCHLKGQVRPATLNAFLASQRAAGSPWKDVIAISALLFDVGEGQLAHDVLSALDTDNPRNRDGLLELGRQYSAIGDQPRALRCFELARSSGEDDFVANHLLAVAHGATGSADRAIEACEGSIAQNPVYGAAHWARARFAGKEGAEQRVARIRAALAVAGVGNDDATFLHYALSRELDALGRADEAWPALVAGAAARRGVTEFNIEKENRAFDALLRVTSGKFLERCGSVPVDITPIFIVGMPCAGMDQLERALGRYRQIALCGEPDDFRQQMQWVNNVRLPTEPDGNFGNFVAHLNYSVLGRRYLDKTRWLTEGKPFYSNRRSTNFMLCGMIMRALPHAKIIHLRRHPMDSCFSSLKELFCQGQYPYSYTLEELANHYRNYDRIMRHWHAVAPGRILDVGYEDLIAQPALQAGRIRNYLGLLDAGNIAGKSSDASAAPRTAGTGVGEWRRYQAGLAPLHALLSEQIKAYEAARRAILLSRL